MKILITGINGFVGFHLSNLLLAKGFQVFGTDRVGKSLNDKIIKFKVDIRDRKNLDGLIKKIKPNFIFHLAALSSVKMCENNILAKEINVDGTNNLLSACFKNNLDAKILITSSAYVYGMPQCFPVDESHPVNPTNNYGLSKLEQEKISLNFFENHRLKVIISRSFNHIGPHQSLGFVCSDFAKQIAEIEKGLIKPEIHVGNLSPKRDFTDVRDIVKAYLFLLERGKPGEIYNVGSGHAYSVKELLDKLISYSSVKIKIIEDPSLFRKSDVPLFLANNKKLVSLTGWKQEFSLDNSLKDVLHFWRNNL